MSKLKTPMVRRPVINLILTDLMQSTREVDIREIQDIQGPTNDRFGTVVILKDGTHLSISNNAKDLSEQIQQAQEVLVIDTKKTGETATFSEYQQATEDTAFLYLQACAKKGIPPWVYVSMGLAGEAGEILNKLKKVIRDKDTLDVTPELTEAAKKEIGDVLWYVAQLATRFGLNLGEIAAENIAKLADRKQRGALGGSGDSR